MGFLQALSNFFGSAHKKSLYIITKNNMSTNLEAFFQDLQKREVIADAANLKNNFYQLKSREKVIYWGVDCTNDSLHIGHLFAILQIIRFAQQDFRIILLLGGATSKIGDPSDKAKERPQLAEKELQNYYQQIEEQITNLLLKEKKIGKLDFQPLELFYHDNPSLLKNIYQALELDKSDPWKKYFQYIWPLDKNSHFQVLNNAEWLNKLSFVDFIDQVGRNITINYLLAKETIKQRVNSETGLSFLAFSYSLLQAYDFYHLYKKYGCHGQLGGSDQWGNLTTGLKLIRSIHPENKTFAFTFPLLTDKEGKKISKSSTGKTIWLSPKKTSFSEFYDFLRNMPDEQALKLLYKFTFLTKEQVEKIAQLNNPRKLRIPQRILLELLFYLLYQEKGLTWLKGLNNKISQKTP
ncbi:MAG: tyrosyl-tRNA synthetase [Mycoplasmataceae bacterium CE_OT135]|nr:MAG: tyrosyl-tRNA synthetase [Mycoplasmataceae bacterium CE_OT135]